ncbi:MULTISPECIES: site-specific integrase [unclassified Gordonia (in: high G+C Gram-positive bacteria)]|uniref:tyrosine-type recombinase/integrase n=1 Tax=unclassified Gordonia (in: high G+C Gram-positive bacteria) TaxID=2657482 RepID=UPI0010FA33F7|nr:MULTISPECIES: site-specific integrase [unclassified Gordonia (in: high G+C Gram-positive bacteria)]
MAGKTRRSFGAIRKLPSKRFQASYVHGAGLTRYTAPHTFTAKIDAEGWLASERRLIETGDWTPPAHRAEAQATKGLTLRTYADRWHAETVNRHKPRTRVLNRGYLDNVIFPGLGDRALKSLTVSDIREWHAGLEDYPTRNANAYSLLRTILNQAVDDEILDANPARVKRAAVKHRKSEPIALSPAEIRALAAAITARYKALVLLGGFSGLRFGELTALRRSDLDMSEDGLAVTVRRAVVRVDGEFVVDRPKSRAALRTVPLPEGLRPALVEHLETYALPGQDGLLFPTSGGAIVFAATFKYSFTRAAEKIGKPALTPHMLRHSAATLFAQAGATLADHMVLMGHTSAAMSARYTHSTESRTRGLVQGLWT